MNKKICAEIAIGIILFVMAIACVFIWVFNKQEINQKPQLAIQFPKRQIEEQPSTEQKIVQPIDEKEEVKKISVGDSTIYYEANKNNGDYADVYFTKSGNTQKIISEVPIGIAGGSVPQFSKLKNPSVVLLTSGDADMGTLFKNYYYIDIVSGKVIAVKTNNIRSLNVTGANEVDYKIELFLENDCRVTEGNSETISEGNTLLADVILNSKKQGLIKNPQVIKCANPGGIGSWYKPDPQIEYVGISSDLSSIVFKVNIIDSEEFYLNLSSGTVNLGKIGNLLKD